MEPPFPGNSFDSQDFSEPTLPESPSSLPGGGGQAEEVTEATIPVEKQTLFQIGRSAHFSKKIQSRCFIWTYFFPSLDNQQFKTTIQSNNKKKSQK